MQTLRSLRLLLVLVTLFIAIQAVAQNGTLSADAYTTPSNPNTNYSTTPSLVVSGSASTNTLTNGPNNRVWLQFDISSLPTGTTAAQVSTATLTV